MQARIINPEITPLKDKILKKIKELLPSPSNQKELSTITNFITFLESVYLGKPQCHLVNKSPGLLTMHMPHTQLEYDVIHYDFKTLLDILQSKQIPQITSKLLSFSEAIPFAACINNQIRVFEDFINNLVETENEDYVMNHQEDVSTNLAMAIRFYIKNQCRICRINKHGRLTITACEDMLLKNMREYLMRYPDFKEMAPGGVLDGKIEMILKESQTDFGRNIDCQEDSLITEYYSYKTKKKLGKNEQYFDEILENLIRKSRRVSITDEERNRCYLFTTILFDSPTFIKVYVLILPCLQDVWLPYTEVKIIYSNHSERVSDIHYYKLPKLLSNFTFVSFVETNPQGARNLFASFPPLRITDEEAALLPAPAPPSLPPAPQSLFTRMFKGFQLFGGRGRKTRKTSKKGHRKSKYKKIKRRGRKNNNVTSRIRFFKKL